MKAYLTNLVIFLFVFSIIIILQSCGNENMITEAPSSNQKNNAALEKTSVINTATTSVSIEDTVVLLPKSKVTIAVKKGLSSDKITLLDDYFSKHKKLFTKSNYITPMLRDCTTHYDYYWTEENQYQPVSSKSLGISNDLNIISLQDAKIIYGFTLAAVSGFDNISTAYNAGYDYPNIMVAYLNPTSALDLLQSNPNLYPKCGYYEIDEPTKATNSYSSTDTKELENLINNWGTGAKVMLTDYHWPTKTLCTDWFNWGAQLGLYQGINYYIMCDEFGGDICGSPCDYWDEYSNYYNPTHVFSNWLDNVNAHYSLWDCCFKLANGTDQNINQIWLWAGNGDLTALQHFCECAWENGWLLRLEKQILVIWKCSDPEGCFSCSWPNSGTWYIYDSYYTGVQEYVAY